MCAALDVCMPDPEIFDMPMKFDLKLMTIILAHLANAEWKLFDEAVNEIDSVWCVICACVCLWAVG